MIYSTMFSKFDNEKKRNSYYRYLLEIVNKDFKSFFSIFGFDRQKKNVIRMLNITKKTNNFILSKTIECNSSFNGISKK